jgi:beta-hydroxylase
VNERYKGKMPAFYEESQFPEAKYIKENYKVIKEEIEDYFKGNSQLVHKPGLIPHKSYEGIGWSSIALYVFGFKRSSHCRHFPKITKIIEAIPAMTSAQISIMKPGAYMKPHIDDTSAIVRIHLGIMIPGILPDVGLRMCGKEVSWKEGELLMLSSMRPHCAWNKTNLNRIIFIVDIVHQQYLSRKYRICGNVLAQLVMKLTASRIVILKKMPRNITFLLHKLLGFGAYLIIVFKKKLNI